MGGPVSLDFLSGVSAILAWGQSYSTSDWWGQHDFSPPDYLNCFHILAGYWKDLEGESHQHTFAHVQIIHRCVVAEVVRLWGTRAYRQVEASGRSRLDHTHFRGHAGEENRPHNGRWPEVRDSDMATKGFHAQLAKRAGSLGQGCDAQRGALGTRRC